MADREKAKIDGLWRVNIQPVRGKRRSAFYLYALGRMGPNQVIHKRTIVRELFALGKQISTSSQIFTDTDIENDKNIHASFDNMLKDGIFTQIEDYSTDVKSDGY